MNKKFFFTLAIFTFLFIPIYAQPEKGKPGSIESYKVQEYYNVLANNSAIMEGPYELWYRGVKLVMGNFSNNEKEGLWKFNNLKIPTKDPNGKIIDSLSREIYYQGYYKNDKKNGAWKYYLNQKPLCTIFFKDNLRDSTWKSFYTNGKLRCLNTYKSGLQNGLFEYYSESGTKFTSKNYVNDVLDGKYILYNQNGEEKVDIEYKMGIPFNVIVLKDNLNNVLEPGTLKDGNGTLKYYDKDGKLSKFETYKNGTKDGLTEEYNTSNGKVILRGTFTNGKKNNDWEYFKSDGTKEKTIILKSDQTDTETTKKVNDVDFVTTFAEQRPQPQGGDDELQSFFDSNHNPFKFDNSLDYYTPSESKIHGTKSMNIRFAVSAAGKIYHLEFDSGLDKDTQDNIQKAFRAMPPWVPGFNEGFPVEYYYFMPIKVTK
jgi:antitoxin component YwqK of YwqJK toxin-antitoxin module